MTRPDLPSSPSLPPAFRRAGRWAGLVGAGALAACIAVWIVMIFADARWPDGAAALYRAWLFAWLLCLGVSLGAMGAVMVHHLTGGEWGYFVRRFGEAAGCVTPVLFVLFIPVFIGLHHIYPWADPHNHSALVVHKHAYLNPGFFIARYVIYFAAWIVMALLLRTLSIAHDRNLSETTAAMLRVVSAIGLVVYFITMSLAAIDWIMSMDPGWYSTVFGFIVCMGQTVAGMSVLIILLELLSRVEPFASRLRPRHFNDLATLLVTAVILWAYNSFAQLLIIWMGNIQHEINWYVQRNDGPWRVLSIILCFLGFLAPFVLLLQRGVKKRGRAMLWVCIGILVMRMLDVYWMVAPGGIEPYPRLHWMNVLMSFVALVAMGGIWIAVVLWLLDRAPLMPLGKLMPPVINPSDAAVPDSRNTEHGTQPGTEPSLA